MNKAAERVINPSDKVIKKQPDPMKIMKTLVSLYADQMGVKITCEIEAGGKCEKFTTK